MIAGQNVGVQRLFLIFYCANNGIKMTKIIDLDSYKTTFQGIEVFLDPLLEIALRNRMPKSSDGRQR